MIDLDDPRYAAWAAARHRHWASLGAVDPDVIAYMISPQFQGAPAWPTTRQSFVVVRRPDSVILASDGLSDLFVDTDLDEPGFGCEVFIETDELVGADFAAIRDSWAFAMIEDFARNVASWGGLDQPLDKMGVLSTELAGPGSLPTDCATPEGRVGVLVNLPNPDRTDRLALDARASIRLVPITLLGPDELAYVVAGGAAARTELGERLRSAGHGILSTTRRRSVL